MSHLPSRMVCSRALGSYAIDVDNLLERIFGIYYIFLSVPFSTDPVITLALTDLSLWSCVMCVWLGIVILFFWLYIGLASMEILDHFVIYSALHIQIISDILSLL